MTRMALEGIKVIDCTWLAVGSWLTRYMADHGADVIHVESATHPEMLRHSPPFKDNIPGVDRAAYMPKFNHNKYGITLNLNHPKGPELLKKLLVTWPADVVAQSYRPGQMEKWGLGYDELKKVKPDIVMVCTSIWGQTGPYHNQPGVGTNGVSLSGVTHITGWPDKLPSGPWGAYTDTPAPRFGVAAVLAALDYRRRTGKGQCIDVSQYEAALYFQIPAILDYTVNGRAATRAGNRLPYAAPHGVFPCTGKDRWIAIAVFDDDEWQAFCGVIGNPDWCRSPKFATMRGRKANEDELEGLIGAWTIQQKAEEIMEKMQQAGVPAGLVSNSQDIYEDPQLTYREHFWTVDHPGVGVHHPDGPPFRLSKTPAQLRMAAPILGRDNDYVYTQILGVPDDELVQLIDDGVLR